MVLFVSNQGLHLHIGGGISLPGSKIGVDLQR